MDKVMDKAMNEEVPLDREVFYRHGFRDEAPGANQWKEGQGNDNLRS